MSYSSQILFAPHRLRDESMNEVDSPPRIRRLQRGRNNFAPNDGGVDNSDGESPQLLRGQYLHSSSESTSSPRTQLSSISPRHSSTGSNCDITDFRRRLEIVKKKRARNMNRSEKATQLSQQMNLCDSSATRIQQYESSSMDESRTTASQGGLQVLKNDLIHPLNDSIVSTCPTLDETTIDTTIDSTMILQNSSPCHRSITLQPPSISSEDDRKGENENSNSLKFHRLLCASSKEKIDPSFANIKSTICNDNVTSTAKDQCDKRYSEIMNGNATFGNEACVGTGEFPSNAVIRPFASFEYLGDGSLDRLLCTKSRPLGGVELEYPRPKGRRHHSSPFSFQALSNDDSEDESENNFLKSEDGCFKTSINKATSTPGRSRRFLQKSFRTLVTSPTATRNFHAGLQDNKHSHYEQKLQTTEIDEIDTTFRRTASPFSLFRKDPWYLRPADVRGCDEDIGSGINSSNAEFSDRMMHAVVFVTES